MKSTIISAIIAFGINGVLAIPAPDNSASSLIERHVIKATIPTNIITLEGNANIDGNDNFYIPTKRMVGGKIAIAQLGNLEAGSEMEIWKTSTGTRERNPIHGMLRIDNETGFFKFFSSGDDKEEKDKNNSLFGYDKETLEIYQLHDDGHHNYEFYGCKLNDFAFKLSVKPTYKDNYCTPLHLSYVPYN